AVRRGNGDLDSRAGPVDVPLEVERDRDLCELPRWHRLQVGGQEGGDRLELRAGLLEDVVGRRGELALARAHPAILNERLAAVRANLADSGLKIDVRRGGLHPRLDGAAPDD